ncbi:MAG: response regulator [Desulfobacterales bacterium]|nr:response regulator [Desulfobacterales bacterium]
MIDLIEMSVLIVDDMESMCKSIRSMLKILKYGKNFTYAFNGLEGWKVLQKQNFDLAIIDWNMPTMTGIELLSLVREDARLRDMPVIMVTAEANREIVAQAAESDIDAYLLKPLTVKSLGDKIVNVIEKANNPPPMLIHLRQARELDESGNLDASIEETKLAMKAEPLSSRPVRELGRRYFKKGNLENSEKCFLKAIKMNKLDVFSYHYLGDLYLRINELDKAEKCLDKAMAISPRHVERGSNFAKILVQKGKVDRAVVVFEKILQIAENPPSMQEEIAKFCFDNNIYDYSARLFELILKKSPMRYDLLFKLAVAKEQLGEHADALNQFLKLEKKDKENVELKMHIAKIFISLNKTINAEITLNGILKLDPANQEAKQLLKNL